MLRLPIGDNDLVKLTLGWRDEVERKLIAEASAR